MSRVHMDREWLAVHAAPAIVRLHEWRHCGRTARPGHREGVRRRGVRACYVQAVGTTTMPASM